MRHRGLRYGFGGAAMLSALLVALASSHAADAVWTPQSALSLSIGQTVVVYAVRGRGCNDAAPSYDSIKAKLPATTLGSFADGGTVQRQSGRCAPSNARAGQGGWVKARAINFTASKPGSEILDFYNDRVAISVK